MKSKRQNENQETKLKARDKIVRKRPNQKEETKSKVKDKMQKQEMKLKVREKIESLFQNQKQETKSKARDIIKSKRQNRKQETKSKARDKIKIPVSSEKMLTRTSSGQTQFPTVVPKHSSGLPSKQLELTLPGWDRSAAMQRLGERVTTVLAISMESCKASCGTLRETLEPWRASRGDEKWRASSPTKKDSVPLKLLWIVGVRKEVNVIVKRADKTAVFVLIDTEVYHRKLDLIPGDSSKFEKLSYNPIKENKREANKTIETINAVTNAIHFQTITGDFSPGYLYGNVKTHKNGNPLRPIISQCPMPTYHLAKRLNSLLTPYVSDKDSVASSAKFLSKVKGSPSSGTMASLERPST
ncbi:uncharacterized protein [Palaemon carinicauda]|uniref:uncharacterized protein n=1 Tax=Palaemon carinicauda TaxID=392227 RepID=UPI0035B5C6E7